MFKVMIADDESWIRKGLKAMIEWERLNLECDSEAVDGLEALQMAEERMPDILITDIRMPGIDGLRLAEKMLRIAPRLKVIIVSGYSDFQYAKRAIQLDAIDYILKPINPAELNKTIEKAAAKLSLEMQEKTASGHLAVVLERLAGDICRCGDLPSARKFCEALKLQGIEPGEAAALLIHYDEDQYDVQAITGLLERAAAAWGTAGRRLIIWERSPQRLSAVVLGENGTAVHKYAKNIWWALKKQNVSGIWGALGHHVPLSDMQLISRSYQEALSVSERHAFSKPEDIIPYSREEEEQLSYKYPLHLQKKLNEALIRDDTDAYEGIIADIEGYYLHTEGASLKHARSFFLSVVSDAVKLMLTKPSFDENIVKAGFDFCLGIDSYDDLPGMTGWLRGFLGKISDFMAGSSQGDVHRSVLLAAEYIREHFAEEISLNSVSTQFHVTSSYFSSMFKEIIGENFIEYLTGARMEKAKEYLTDSGMKIAEVGERVGYADSRYFSRLFRKHTGQMPSEYRQSPPASPADGQHEA